MARKAFHRHREFLNSTEGIALVESVVHLNIEPERTPSHDSSLTLGDCNRVVTLDFSIWRCEDFAEDAALIRAKVQRLRAAVNNFCDAVLDATSQVEAAPLPPRKPRKSRAAAPTL